MTSLFKILVISFLTVSVKNIVAGCEQTFTDPFVANAKSAKSLLGYLQKAFEEHFIGQEELVRLVANLEENILENPITHEQAMLDGQLQIHEKNIGRYIDKGDIDLTELLLWAEKKLVEKERVKKRRDDTREDTKEPYPKIKFYPVPKGSFKIGEKNKKTVNLTNNFEMMSTQVTQWQWTQLIGGNPSLFTKGEHTVSIKINGKDYEMQPENPVENVTWWSGIYFANELSRLHKLEPAYDFSKIKWKPGTSVADGTLDVLSGNITINAPNGDYYKAEGYRLPTAAEQEYMLRATGTKNGKYYFGDNESKLREHAWYRENAEDKTHPVGKLLPLKIDGKPFYDLHGNVWEWGWDWYKMGLKGGKNPLGPSNGTHHVFRGGGWESEVMFLRSDFNSFFGAEFLNYTVGIRLVRTLKENE